MESMSNILKHIYDLCFRAWVKRTDADLEAAAKVKTN